MILHVARVSSRDTMGSLESHQLLNNQNEVILFVRHSSRQLWKLLGRALKPAAESKMLFASRRTASSAHRSISTGQFICLSIYLIDLARWNKNRRWAICDGRKSNCCATNESFCCFYTTSPFCWVNIVNRRNKIFRYKTKLIVINNIRNKVLIIVFSHLNQKHFY